MYKIVDPVDAATPSGAQNDNSKVFIQTIDVGHPMEIHWYLDDVLVTELDGMDTIAISSLQLQPGVYSLSVTVVDPTPWVRDESARDSFMKQTFSWPVQILNDPCPADLNDDDMVGILDLLAIIDAWGTCQGCAADLDGNNLVNVADLLMVVDAWGACS
jgi:hypothetical protein